MSVQTLLDRLDGVKRTGRDRWIARCPAHDDRKPSLAIRELDDGRVLVHDFAGCPVEIILSACGLDFEALFPQHIEGHRLRGERRPFGPADALRCIAGEVAVVVVVASDVAGGLRPSAEDHVRLLKAVERIQLAAEACDAA